MKLHTLPVLGLATGIFACAEKEQPPEGSRDTAVLDHMHAHAVQLEKLNLALDEGDFERAMISAYWLSRHEAVSGLPKCLGNIIPAKLNIDQGWPSSDPNILFVLYK